LDHDDQADAVAGAIMGGVDSGSPGRDRSAAAANFKFANILLGTFAGGLVQPNEYLAWRPTGVDGPGARRCRRRLGAAPTLTRRTLPRPRRSGSAAAARDPAGSGRTLIDNGPGERCYKTPI